MALRRRGQEYSQYLRANNSKDAVIPYQTWRRWLREGKITEERLLELGINPRSRRPRGKIQRKAAKASQPAITTESGDELQALTSADSPSSTQNSPPYLDMDLDELTDLQDDGNSNDFMSESDDSDNASLDAVDSEKSNRIADILESKKIGVEALNESLAPGLSISKFETLLMIFHLAMRHSLTDIFLTDLMQFVNVLVGLHDAIPESMYLFRKLFMFGSEPIMQFFCPQCQLYIGPKNSFQNDSVSCNNCEWLNSVSSLNSGNYFITLGIRDQLKTVLSNSNLKMIDANQSSNRVITDISDGRLYQKLMKRLHSAFDLDNLTVSISTDGSPVFENGPNSLWPIHFHLNEIHPSQRFDVENILLGGLWFSKTCEPNIQIFLQPMVAELQDLSDRGITWTKPNGSIIESKVHLLTCCADSVARPKVQCMMQFNGSFGCSYCLHPNTSFVVNEPVKQQCGYRATFNEGDSDGSGSDSAGEREASIFRRKKILRYLSDEIYPLRTNKELREHMKLASRSPYDHIYGAKGISVLSDLKFFNIVWGLPIDYLHSVLLGVVKRLANLWFDRTSNGHAYYIGLKIDRVNHCLSQISTPSNLSRPRPMSDRAHWKAKEWRSFLLYYGLPCLLGILPEAYYVHFRKLVSAIYVLSQESIKYEEVDEANDVLHAFVSEYQSLYGEINMVFNVHLLIHLPKTVSQLGPLWAYSMFPFESANGRLVKLVKGTRSISYPLARKFLMIQTVGKILCGNYSAKDEVITFCSNIVEYKYLKHSTVTGCVRLLGRSSAHELTNEQRNALLNEGILVERFVSVFNRAAMNGTIFVSRQSGKQKVVNDSCVRVKDGKFFMIDWILAPDKNIGESNVWCLATEVNIAVNVANSSMPAHIKHCALDPFGSVKALPFVNISKKCFFISSGDKFYVAEFANSYEKS